MPTKMKKVSLIMREIVKMDIVKETSSRLTSSKTIIYDKI